MKKFSLVSVSGVNYIMLNAEKTILNSHCNSTIFEKNEDSFLNINVFDYFETEVIILKSNLDRRKKEFKELEKKYKYFSVGFLKKPLLKTVFLKRWVNNGIKFVRVYRDKEGTDLKCSFNSTLTSLPNKRRKLVTLGCFKYKVKWID